MEKKWIIDDKNSNDEFIEFFLVENISFSNVLWDAFRYFTISEILINCIFGYSY